MIRVRLDGEEISLDPDELARLWEDGRIPPSAWILEGDRWVRATESALAQRASPVPRLEAMQEARGLGAVLFPRRGLSATEALLLVNILVMAALIALLRDDYERTVWQWARGWWHGVTDRHLYPLWVPTLFMHADLGHLGRNMISLLGSAGAVEYLLGRGRTFAIYLLTGLAAAALSYVGHGRPPLSIGASGAIFGLFGTVVGYLIRNYGTLTAWERWKARRVYAPFLVFLVLPSLFHADYMAHVGGFVAGLAGGVLAGRRRSTSRP